MPYRALCQMKVVELGFCSQTRPVSLSKPVAPPMTRRNRSAVASGSLHPFGDSGLGVSVNPCEFQGP